MTEKIPEKKETPEDKRVFMNDRPQVSKTYEYSMKVRDEREAYKRRVGM